tara:strand:+ start:215 stop:733 length:519 start_codon:yes stop_codon:yes gene_type:complete
MNRLFEVYSKGLYQSLKSVEVENIKQIFEAIASSENIKSLKIFFKDKTISKKEKLQTALSLVNDDSSIEPFFKTIADNNRFDLLPDLFQYFLNYCFTQEDNIPVNVKLNKEPTDEIKERISSFVSNKFNKSMQVNYEIDSSLIGGIIIKHKDNEIDLSLDNKLSGLKELLIN